MVSEKFHILNIGLSWPHFPSEAAQYADKRGEKWTKSPEESLHWCQRWEAWLHPAFPSFVVYLFLASSRHYAPHSLTKQITLRGKCLPGPDKNHLIEKITCPSMWNSRIANVSHPESCPKLATLTGTAQELFSYTHHQQQHMAKQYLFPVLMWADKVRGRKIIAEKDNRAERWAKKEMSFWRLKWTLLGLA